MFEDKAVAAVMEPMTDIVQSASEGRSANCVALSKLPHPLPAPPAAKSTDQAGRAKMAGQPWQVSPALHESAWLPLVVGAQHKKNTATPCTADDFAL